MQFTTTLLALAATAVALPNVGPSPDKGNAVGGKQDAFWPVSDDVTVEQAKAACGNDNQIACCDDTTFTGDQVEVESGPLAGALKNLLGGKNGAKGLGLFDKCSKLNIDGEFLCPSPVICLLTLFYSPHWYLRSYQQPVQAEHCLLPGRLCRLLWRPRRSQHSLRCPWLSSLSSSFVLLWLCLLSTHVKSTSLVSN